MKPKTLDEGDQMALFVDVTWHPKAPILAVSSSEQKGSAEQGTVSLYSDDGEAIDQPIVIRSSVAQLLAWHPTQRILAVGFANGELLSWSEASQTAHDTKPLHATPIMVLEWSPSGETLVSADYEGRIGIWKPNKIGRLTLVADFKRPAAITHVAFKPINVADGTVSEFPFFVASADTSMYSVTAQACVSIAFLPAAIHSLLFNPEGDTLLVVTQNMTLVFYEAGDGFANVKREIKVTGRIPYAFVWIGAQTLAAATADAVVRIWDFEADENTLLNVQGPNGSPVSNIAFSGITFDPVRRVIAAGTAQGSIYLWKAKLGAKEGEPKWVFQTSSDAVSSQVTSMSWGHNMLAVSTHDSLSIFKEQTMTASFGNLTIAAQISASKLLVESAGPATSGKGPVEVEAGINIKGIFAGGDMIAAWSGRSVALFELNRDRTAAKTLGTFKSEATAVVLFEQSVYCAEGSAVNVRNTHGASKQMLLFNDNEGDIVALDFNGRFLTAATSQCVIRVWDLSRREVRPHGLPKSFKSEVDSLSSVRISANGSRVAFIGSVDGNPDSSVWVWDVEHDHMNTFDFNSTSRVPATLFWDPVEPRLLVCEARPSADDLDRSIRDNMPTTQHELVSMFITPDDGLKVQDRFLLDDKNRFVGAQVPRFYFLNASAQQSGQGNVLVNRVMRDFVGLEAGDQGTMAAMLEFSYFLTVGNVDEAFRAVQSIKSPAVWQNMARMCVTTKRMDVATVCMGNMRNVIGARALREAQKEPELEARVAALAIQLGMYDEAVSLYKECSRYDLLNKLYQDRGQWDNSLTVAKEHDRIHLRSTYYKQAKQQEHLGEKTLAAELYERSQTHGFEVPRMLFDNLEALEAFIKPSHNKSLLKWWAQFQESTGNMDSAMKYYAAADDQISLVRVYCFCGSESAAIQVVESTGDRAAAYQLARHFESVDRVEDAIKYYSRSGCYSNAIRLAKEHNLKQLMLGLALRSSKADMIEAAEFYEGQGAADKAVTLYHKGGRVSKALDLCFKYKLYQHLATIAEDLDQNADPAILEKAAKFFNENNQKDKAVGLLIVAKKYEEAIDMCYSQRIILTEDMAEKMTIAKAEEDGDDEFRNKILEKIGDCCVAQESWALATKKYTQAGSRVKAMKCLLRDGDVEKVVHFAKRCAQKEIYIMAANFLQSKDWRRDADMMEKIITFYTKAKALDNLANFYDACAQAEIDEFQNYQKALDALHEALKCMSKAKSKDSAKQEAAVANLQNRYLLVEKFVKLKEVQDINDLLTTAQLLLEEPDLETGVRIGDIYALIVERLAAREEYKKAYQYIEELRQRVRNVNVSFFINIKVLETIHRALGIPLGSGRGDVRSNDDDIPDES